MRNNGQVVAIAKSPAKKFLASRCMSMQIFGIHEKDSFEGGEHNFQGKIQKRKKHAKSENVSVICMECYQFTFIYQKIFQNILNTRKF